MSANFLSPLETAQALQKAGIAKTKLPISKMLILGILAGVYIGFGSHLCTTVVTGTAAVTGFGLSKFIGGGVFSVGLMLVVIAGAELFTGNSLMSIALLTKKVKTSQLLKSWGWVYVANLVGSILLAWLIYQAGMNNTADGLSAVGETAVKIAQAKAALSLNQVFFRAILANWLVCLAVWLAVASKDVVSKIFACFFPIMAFVAMGFEHSIANMYFFSAAMFAQQSLDLFSAGAANIAVATIGNIIGGAMMVGMAYWHIHLKDN